MKLVRRLVRDEEGTSAVEYALLGSLIAVVIIAAVTVLGTNMRDVFNYIADNITTTGA